MTGNTPRATITLHGDNVDRQIHISFRCSAELDRRLRLLAAMRDVNRSELIIELIKKELDNSKRRKKNTSGS